MATPAIQTLITDAQQVLNLKSLSEIRATMAAALANANVGTPLNPNLTTQQLWDQFYLIVRQPESDIESIITNQLMKFLFAPPAPGGVGGNHEVIYNNNGVLAGDPKFLWEDALNRLDIDGSATITGDLTVDTSTLKVDSTNNRVGIGTASPAQFVHLSNSNTSTALTSPPVGGASLRIQNSSSTNNNFGSVEFYNAAGLFGASVNCQYTNQATPTNDLVFVTRGSSGGLEHYRIAADGVATWSEVGGVAGTAMTLNSTGLGVGGSPQAWNTSYKGVQVGLGAIFYTNAGTPNNGWFATNTYQDAANTTTFIGTGYGMHYRHLSGEHAWLTSTASGSAGGTATMTQMMTLDASGNLLVGKTTTAATALGGVAYIGRVDCSRDTGNAATFNHTTAGNLVGNIAITSTATTYNSASDYRLKEAIQPLSGGLARVSALKPSIYKWKVDGSSGEGFLAHELADVVPLAVTGEKDAVDADGKPEYQGVDLSKVVPILVAAIQELTARVQTLEAR